VGPVLLRAFGLVCAGDDFYVPEALRRVLWKNTGGDGGVVRWQQRGKAERERQSHPGTGDAW